LFFGYETRLTIDFKVAKIANGRLVKKYFFNILSDCINTDWLNQENNSPIISSLPMVILNYAIEIERCHFDDNVLLAIGKSWSAV